LAMRIVFKSTPTYLANFVEVNSPNPTKIPKNKYNYSI
jgi:hypothetical protein